MGNMRRRWDTDERGTGIGSGEPFLPNIAKLGDAMRDPSFLLLTAGFFTCGFHIAFIATHLPGYVELCQLPATVSAWSLSIIGLFNILGSL